MSQKTCILVGAPVDCGKRRQGCLMGPDAYRTAELDAALRDLGHDVHDWGNMKPADGIAVQEDGKSIKLQETVAWVHSLADAGYRAMVQGTPIFLGGDHALAAGSVAGIAKYAAEQGRPLFVLWLDAHSDYHTPQSSSSGNLHGTPVGYLVGREGFDSFPPMQHPIPHENVCMIGLRSVDEAERDAMQSTAIRRHDMREIDEHGIARPLADFLSYVADHDGMLHVSLDVDFLDPSFAPAVGTTVPGGATEREAHLVMEMLHDSGLVTSMDLVELNPFLDERGRTAQVMVDLVASAFGRRIFDRPTRAFS